VNLTGNPPNISVRRYDSSQLNWASPNISVRRYDSSQLNWTSPNISVGGMTRVSLTGHPRI
jgi:hypothetical protein